MKKIIFLLLTISALRAGASDPSKTISPKINSVMLYLNGAVVNQVCDVQLNKGKTELVFINISANINAKRINISSSEGVKIMSVSHRVNDSLTKNEPAAIRSVKDSLRKINDELETLRLNEEALMEERNLLMSNKSIGGQNNGVAVAELQKAADFYRARLADINNQLLKIRNQKSKFTESKDKNNQRLNELMTNFKKNNNEIVVTVQAAAELQAKFNLSYFVTGAGWSAYYDIKFTDIGSPVTFDYKAKVYNNTGVNWDQVRITLSTADPSKSADIPAMTPWTLNYRNTMNNEGTLDNYRMKSNTASAPSAKYSASTDYESSEVYVSELSVNFEIKELYSIPADLKSYSVDIQTYKLPAHYEYFCIPKIELEAFLLAKIIGWEELNIVEGPANIYNGTNFIGESYIDTRYSNDTLNISLGRDKKVVVNKVKRQDKSGKKVIGLNKTENFLYEISIRNNNRDSIQIVVWDQVPVSQESDIIVDVEEISKAELEPMTGRLIWNLKLPPSETQKLNISFSVKYPKNKNVQIRKNRKVSNVRSRF